MPGATPIAGARRFAPPRRRFPPNPCSLFAPTARKDCARMGETGRAFLGVTRTLVTISCEGFVDCHVRSLLAPADARGRQGAALANAHARRRSLRLSLKAQVHESLSPQRMATPVCRYRRPAAAVDKKSHAMCRFADATGGDRGRDAKHAAARSPAEGAGLSPSGARAAPRPAAGRLVLSRRQVLSAASSGARHGACAKTGEARHPPPGS